MEVARLPGGSTERRAPGYKLIEPPGLPQILPPSGQSQEY